MRGQLPGRSALDIRNLQVTCVTENHLVTMQVREPQKTGIGIDAGEGKQQKKRGKKSAHWRILGVF